MSTRYDVIIRRYKFPDGDVNTLRVSEIVIDTLASFELAPAWEVAPALKQLAKKIHESPPPVVLEGQEAMPWS